jgi:hypothetical protein
MPRRGSKFNRQSWMRVVFRPKARPLIGPAWLGLMRRFATSLLIGLVLLISTGVPRPLQAAATWYVATTGNNSPACNTPSDPCATINGAIAKASNGDVIHVAVGLYTGSGDQVVFLNKDLALHGGWNPGFTAQVGYSTIDGQAVRRGLVVAPGVTASATRLIAQNGYTTLNGSAGGISNRGMLELSESSVINSQSENDVSGGGIYNSGIITVTRSTIKDNQGWCGGGIYNQGGILTVDGSVIAGNNNNTPYGNGAGICTTEVGTVAIRNSAITGNTGYGSGALYIEASAVVITNSTLSGNSTGYWGGAIYLNSGTLYLNSSTMTDNSAGASTGGLYTEQAAAGSSAVLRNSIIADNSSYNPPHDCSGSLTTSGGYNLLGSGCPGMAGLGDLVGVNPQLGPLTGNVGYHPLLANSPAINAGDPAGCRDEDGNLVSTDQRGAPRVGRCDIGAYEAGWLITKTVSGQYRPGSTVDYSVGIASPYGTIEQAVITDTLPAALTLIANSISANNGATLVSGNTLTWTGTITGGTLTSLNFQASIAESAIGQWITNTAISAWSGYSIAASAVFDTLPRVYLPATYRDYCPSLFFDDFSHATGWPVGEDDYVAAQIAGGEYRVVSKQPYLFLFRSPACARANYVVEADMRWNGETGSDIGLLVGLTGNFGQYYFIDINTDLQAYAIFRRNANGSFSAVAPPAQSSAIHSGTQTNHLEVTRIDQQIGLEINGQFIGVWLDGTIGGLTFAGVAMAPYDDRPVADARFDNFSVSTLGAGMAAASSDDLSTSSSPLVPWWQPLGEDIAPAFDPTP